MAIACASLTAGTDADGNSTATTASITPGANRLILLSVTSRTGITADPNQPTATGNSLTWVVINSIVWDSDSSSRKRTTLFRAMGSSPTTGAISIAFGGQNQTNVIWGVDECTGMDTTGTNGSGAIVQSATGKDETSGGGTLTITLGAFSGSGNATYGAFGGDYGVSGVTEGSGFTKISEDDSSSENMTEFRPDNDTTVTAVEETDANFKIGGVAIEIRAAAILAQGKYIDAGFTVN